MEEVLRDQLLLTYAEIVDRVDSGVIVDIIIFLDISKVFDVVSHSLS